MISYTVVSLSDGSRSQLLILVAKLSALFLGFIESLQWYTSHGVVVDVYDGVPRRPILLEHLGDEIQVILAQCVLVGYADFILYFVGSISRPDHLYICRGLLLSFTSSDVLIMKWISSVVISANGVDSRLVQLRVNGSQGCVQ
jgi:hypothetical protein